MRRLGTKATGRACTANGAPRRPDGRLVGPDAFRGFLYPLLVALLLVGACHVSTSVRHDGGDGGDGDSGDAGCGTGGCGPFDADDDGSDAGRDAGSDAAPVDADVPTDAEPDGPDALPDADDGDASPCVPDCTGRQCGPDPICGAACRPGCARAHECTTLGGTRR